MKQFISCLILALNDTPAYILLGLAAGGHSANANTDALVHYLAGHQSEGGVPINDPAYQRGVQYLLKTSKLDGTWHVQTRVFPFQKYFESGFPYGKDQFISAAATSWAVMALALTIDPPAKIATPLSW